MNLEIKELWEELKFELGGMKLPKLDGVKEKKLLVGAGNREAEIFFIGDDPELYDDEELKVSMGTSGEFFVKLCDLADLSPEKYYISNLSKCALKWRELTENEREHMRDYLDMQIALIKPKIIVSLGQEVTSILMGKEIKIPDMRGKVYPFLGGIKLIPTFDPSYVKRTRDAGGRKAKPAIEFWNDLKMIKAEIEN